MMGSAEGTCLTTSKPLTIFQPADCSRPPSPVALSVMADVHVYRYDDSQSSADESSSRVVVVTSLSAIVKELSSAAVLSKGDEYLAGPSESQSVSFEIYSHPRVRASKKATCLIKGDASQDDVQTSISRMVLLSYPGCSEDERMKAAWRKKFFIKSSKTWERVVVQGGREVEKRTRSQMLRPPPGSKKVLRPAVRRVSKTNWQLDSDSSTSNTVSRMLLRGNLKNIRQSLSETQVFFKDEKSRTYLCSPLHDPRKKSSATVKSLGMSDLAAQLARLEEEIIVTATRATLGRSESEAVFKYERSRTYSPYVPDESLKKSATTVKSLRRIDPGVGFEKRIHTLDMQATPERSDLRAHLAGFDGEIFSPDSFPKSTRNVSILHRPRTRTTATSTSSLDAYFDKKRQKLGDTIKDALSPYIAAGNYPSELVLKLVPKKRVEEDMKKMEHETDNGSSRHSEVDLLAPKLDDVKASKKVKKDSKKKERNFFGLLCCFSKPKKVDDDDGKGSDSDGESGVTKVYYPSIVEVREGKQGKIHDEDDDSRLAYIIEHRTKSKSR